MRYWLTHILYSYSSINHKQPSIPKNSFNKTTTTRFAGCLSAHLQCPNLFFLKKFNIRSLIKSHQPLGTVLSQNFNLARTSLKIIPQRWVGTWNIVWLTHRYAFITNKLRQRKRDLSAYVSRLTIKSKDFKLQHHNLFCQLSSWYSWEFDISWSKYCS